MYSSFRILLFSILFTSISGTISATHNRSGEITYAQLDPLTIRATITTYTKASSIGADRDSLVMFWGDGTSDMIGRSNGNGDGEIIPDTDIKVNYYIFDHTYPGSDTYTMSFQDLNRVNNIQNVNYPNSVDIPFFVQTTLTLNESQFKGPNSSVILLQPPIDYACVGQKFVHNPNAYDPDGDSISYSLVVPLQSEDTPVPKYLYPNAIPGANSSFTLNSVNGDLIWDAPNVTGEYNVAIQINEYRDGVLLNSVMRDMQILVIACEDSPPELEVINEICVVAGTELRIPVRVTDIDTGQMVRLSASGGPFEIDYSPAILSNQFVFTESPLDAVFVWDTKCEHIRDAYYQVVFRGQDNARQGLTGNSVLKNLRIKIVGPPPLNLDGEIMSNDIKLTWDKPYDCEETIDNYFVGFRVYKKIGSNPFERDTCINGLKGKGYEIARHRTDDQSGNSYTYTDTNLDKENIYCYRVVALFAKRTPTGNLYDIVESLTSDEYCVQLQQDLPLITEVSVVQTDESAGLMNISWLKPNPDDLDTLVNKGPYTYQIHRSSDNMTFTQVEEITNTFFGREKLLSFSDSNLNTRDQKYYYRVDFFSEGVLFSSSKIASSVRSEVTSSDKVNFVDCSEQVPWKNYSYTLQLLDNQNGMFQDIETKSSCDFIHDELENEIEYCYRVKSTGTYGLPNTPDSLINFSQIICGTPLDTIGPCPPIVKVINPCDEIFEGGQDLTYLNILNWGYNSGTNCPKSGDLENFNIYFSSDSLNQDFLLIYSTVDNLEERYEHLPEFGLNGCYAVSGIDTLGNEGPLSKIICVPNCPIYELPNTFTPNSDGANDLFIPRRNRFVASVEFKVFNRWGNLLFETADPELNWNGFSDTGSLISEGTYYYTCTVFERGLGGNPVEALNLNGYIQILR